MQNCLVVMDDEVRKVSLTNRIRLERGRLAVLLQALGARNNNCFRLHTVADKTVSLSRKTQYITIF